jgi:phosphate butyryltransferase
MRLEALLDKTRQSTPRRIAVAAAQDIHVLRAVAEAYLQGIALPVLCGDLERIDALARLHHIDISPFEIVEAESDGQAIAMAVSLVRDGRADVLMKGIVSTADLLRAVLDKQTGLRGAGILSHVGMLYVPYLDRTLYLTDGGIVPYPDVETKAAIVRNAVSVARAMGGETPRVAVLAAMELVNPKMPASLDAALLAAMNRRGQIRDCVVDGPLSMDLALSPEAAAIKGVASDVAGKADILLFHSIEAANAVTKAFVFGMGCAMGGLIVGATAPIVLTSRADSAETKLLSIAAAIHCAGAIKKY